MLRTGYIFNKNFNSLLTYKHLTLAGLLVIASPSRSGVLFSFFLSCEGKKERKKKERSPAAFFLAEKGMCFRNKMNLLLKELQTAFYSFGNASLFLFAKKMRPE